MTAEGVKTKTRFDQNHRKIIEVLSRLGDIAVASEVVPNSTASTR